ncbi:hypothetical protein NDU88_003448 [Pleurodeles waltl]|uniref:Uncharacterized protein n=1 Tax=Pleurodeles waltl TaxID=8319 RepID=A0AAV7TP29_PLEWA|nr:hypothetical protein NDU88_003448 [Pleurodeles waltl]
MMVLIPKKGRDPTYLSSYRPLDLQQMQAAGCRLPTYDLDLPCCDRILGGSSGGPVADGSAVGETRPTKGLKVLHDVNPHGGAWADVGQTVNR